MTRLTLPAGIHIFKGPELRDRTLIEPGVLGCRLFTMTYPRPQGRWIVLYVGYAIVESLNGLWSANLLRYWFVIGTTSPDRRGAGPRRLGSRLAYRPRRPAGLCSPVFPHGGDEFCLLV